ncbi:MAG: DUF1573 domain-containing protein [Bacteroidia bacterium]|jgi:hypothetical protein|nr:DUF1573 domain-containing protein [Bacteroidia bacterium]
MKVTRYFILLLAFVGVCSLANAQQPMPTPEISFETVVHDFGNIKEGTLATYNFTFTNTGKAPLILSNVQASCGCTSPEWTKEPIMPGQKGTIKAVYNSYNRPGVFQKYITVKSNALTTEVQLTIKGTVEPKPIEPVSPVRNNQSE